MKMVEVKLHTSEEYYDLLEQFMTEYSIEHYLIPAESNKHLLKPKTERKCRFCGKSSSETTFKSVAHLYPEALGNKLVFSDFECDQCNTLFGTYDDHLVKFIEPDRPLNKLRGKEKFPKFSSPKKELQIQVQDFFNKQSIKISRANSDDNTISFNQANGIMKVKFKKNSFSPNKVYKSLVKIAMSILPENEVTTQYGLCLDYLVKEKIINLKPCRMTSYMLPLGINQPAHGFIFKKIDAEKKSPTYVFYFYVFNYLFCIPLLLNKDDFWFYNQPLRDFTYPPLFLTKVDFERTKIQRSVNDYDSNELVKGLEQEITIEIAKVDLENMTGYDPKTKQFVDPSKFDSNTIMSLHILNTEDDNIDITKKDVE